MPQLNDRQHEAVTSIDGAVLVIAGAGSGKTRVLTERIAHLVRDHDVKPWQILAFTFTNRAAREMKARLEDKTQGITDKLWVGTFHGTGVRILKAHGSAIGIERNFSIYDSGDSLDLVKGIIARESLQMLRSPKSVRDRVSRWKNEFVTPDEAADNATDNIDKRMVMVYREYEKGLRRANALDFDDLILRCVELFSNSDEVKNHYARRFRYILVDEFQDTNPMQMALIDALASYHKNLFVVGDDDQSIYSWRGARVEHILNFEGLYAGTRVVRLEQNYRSTQNILDAANHVIANNVGRKGKSLWTAGDRGDKITVLHSMDEEGEAMVVLQTVRTLVQQGYNLKDIAVLYRTNAQSRALEDVLKLGSLPYQIIGSVRFYERAEVRDVLAYCKLLVNPADDVSLKRILNVPKRGLGKTSYDRLAATAVERDTSIMQVLRSGSFDLGTAQVVKLREFVQVYERLSQVAAEETAPRVVEAILDQVRYRKYLEEAYPDAESRVENVEELVSAAEEFIDRGDEKTLQAFLEEIALVADVDSFDEQLGQLTLMTLHNAKGLEFDAVVIAGLEDGLFPHANSFDSADAIEEERRLFYVGMTRARKQLYCSYANMRRRMGVMEGGTPSRFLYELPENLIEGGDTLGGLSTQGRATLDAWDTTPQVAPREFEDYSQEELAYTVGARIVHNDFGTGIVRRIEGSGENLRVTVIFDRGGERKFLAIYAPMRPM